MTTPTWSVWDMRDRFSVAEAAFLWLNMTPMTCATSELLGAEHQFPVEVQVVAWEIERECTTRVSVDGDPQWLQLSVPREELESLAERKGVRPLFLFPGDRQPEMTREPETTAEASPAARLSQRPTNEPSQDTLYQVIRALTLALAETDREKPEQERKGLLKDNGRPFPGYDRDKSVGIVGHLRVRRFTTLSTSALEKVINRALSTK
jgi:hypothetical protein